jgi:hypothetical protein
MCRLAVARPAKLCVPVMGTEKRKPLFDTERR